jgi:acetate kinase
MRVLAINCGSSSLKFDVLAEMQSGPSRKDAIGQEWVTVASGLVDRIGKEGRLRLKVGGETRHSEAFAAADIGEATRRALALLRDEGLLEGLGAVGHRVVHGGPVFAGPAVIDDEVVQQIEALSTLAPLHNKPALEAIDSCRRELPDLRHVAVFDTSFYVSLPDHVALYALPRELSEKHRIRRYGFHGLAHRSMLQHYAAQHPDAGDARIVSLQLGSGCSITASRGGTPVETSMGFTPLEGLVMGTRSGDLDPSLPLFIAEHEKLSPHEVESLLNRESGLLGLSGRSADMRDLQQAARDGDEPSKLAIDAFCHRARKYLGAYLAVLGGCEAVIFGGGIGQNDASIRAQICDGMQWAGIDLDEGRNASGLSEGRISSDGAAVEVWVADVDEAAIIAQDVAVLLRA